MTIRDWIPTGHANGITQNELATMIGITGRDVRRMIADENETGERPIINLQDGAGYFIPDENETHLINDYIYQETSRVRKQEKKLRVMRKYVDNIGQMELAL